MTSIDPTGRLLAYLRQQTQEWRRQHPSEAGPLSPGSTADKRSALDLAAAQVAAIDKDDPQARRKAFRIYLASVLMQELGADIANDPGFAGMVDRVQGAMETEAQLKEAMKKAGEFLLKSAHPVWKDRMS